MKTRLCPLQNDSRCAIAAIASDALQPHRLTWRMWHPVTVYARSREDAIREALATAPTYIPAGTELHYGMVTASANAVGHKA